MVKRCNTPWYHRAIQRSRWSPITSPRRSARAIAGLVEPRRAAKVQTLLALPARVKSATIVGPFEQGSTAPLVIAPTISGRAARLRVQEVLSRRTRARTSSRTTTTPPTPRFVPSVILHVHRESTASIHYEIRRLRHSTPRRCCPRDVIVVASVPCIYGSVRAPTSTATTCVLAPANRRPAGGLRKLVDIGYDRTPPNLLLGKFVFGADITKSTPRTKRHRSASVVRRRSPSGSPHRSGHRESSLCSTPSRVWPATPLRHRNEKLREAVVRI